LFRILDERFASMKRHDFDPSTVKPDGRPASKATLFDPARDGPWRGSLNGDALGGLVTVLAYGNDTPGKGPGLHVHPYDETFVVVQGRARFFVGDQVIEAVAGEAVLGPAGVPHRFENLGPGRLQTIDIHHSPRWIQTDLD
jgi:mannose-6-phosphate isomerase-like protein (cupin superfamily)